MANNVAVTAGTGTTFKTTDTAGVHTGHINVDSSALPSGAATAAKQPALGTAGTASADVITVQGIASGTAQPISGTVTANAGTGTLAVSLASVPSHAVTNAGTFATQVSSIAAGTNNIGDVDVLTVPTDPFGANADAASATGSISAKLRFIAATGIPVTGTTAVSGTVTANLSATDNTVLDNIEAGIDELKAEVTSGTIDSGTVASRSVDVVSVMPPVISTKLIISGATSGDNTVLAAQGAGNSICVHSLFLIAAAAVAVRFESGAAGTALTGVMSLAANGGFVLPYNPDGWFETADNALLNMELGGAIQVSGALTYSVR